jgi:hypothetical protein
MEFPMAVRQWFGDVALAIVLALPLAALAYSQPIIHAERAGTSTIAAADQFPATGRIGLLGR